MKLAPCIALLISVFCASSFGSVDGAISGTVADNQGLPIGNAPVELETAAGAPLTRAKTTATGTYQFYPLSFGDYLLKVDIAGFAPYSISVHVVSGATTEADIQLSTPVQAAAQDNEMVLNVQAKRQVVHTSEATSRKEITSKQISEVPQGENVSLPHLLASTTPGIIQGPFGETFVRGNHANIQYQIDGVQLPDSQSGAFGDAFTPRNIDHMEVITGGIPAEYGNRLAAVVNIVTKSGPETPGGEAELNYGSYDTFSPWAVYGGSNEKGDLHYFFSTQYSTTSRGLDTPQPQSESSQSSGGTDAIHDDSNGYNQFMKLDWLPDNDDKISVIGFNNYTFYQIPNYPSSFLSSDSFFSSGFTDQFGNTNGAGQAPIFTWTPSTTNDTQAQRDAYLELVWKRTLTEHAFYQQAAFYKYSIVDVGNDPANDLASAALIPFATPASLSEARHVNNWGVKGDFTDRFNDNNLFKAGYQFQQSLAAGPVNVSEQGNTGGTFGSVTGLFTKSSADNSTANGLGEGVYAQDDLTLSKKFILNAGLRFDAIQYRFLNTQEGAVTSNDNQLQPRIGLNYFASDTTKLHAFYGRLFMPAPLEDLRDTFNDLNTSGNTLGFFDVQAEKDNYYEVGVAQQVKSQVVTLNTYYKNATNMLDDNELLNTSLTSSFNYATGYAYGVELSVQGQLTPDWGDYLNYSYEIAKGQGASGGIFSSSVTPASGYGYLDHVQLHTANAGVSYIRNYWHWMTQGLFGSGLRTGPNNSLSLPSHFTMDTSLGYDFHGKSWLTKVKVSADMLNIFNDSYPITVANGFNASHYAAGREFFVHLTKEL